MNVRNKWTSPFLNMKVSIGVVSPKDKVIKDVKELEGKTLIVTKGTTAETYFEKNYPNIKLQKYDQYSDAYQALLDGRGDASQQIIQKFLLGL